MFERSTPPAVGEEAEVANANQPLGQNVDEEASQQLIRGNGHDLLLAAVGIVSPAEGDAIVFEGYESMVGDGDAVGIAGQLVENILGAAERWLGIDHPVLPAEFGEEVAESGRQGKLLQRAMELEPVVFEQFTKPRPELAAEAAAKCLDGQEEACRRIDPSGTIGSQAAGGNDVVDMGMVTSTPTIP
jgi:hypothetical protein